MSKVAVCSKSFSKSKILRDELLKLYPNSIFNDLGRELVGEELINFVKGFAKIIVGLEKINDEVLSQLPDLKVISKYGVGLDGLDLRAIEKHRIKLGWTPGVNKRSVAELTLALMLSVLRQLPSAHREVLAGVWRQVYGFQLTGKTIGIIGLGNIGCDLVTLLQPFQCEILVNDILDKSSICKQQGLKQVDLKTLLTLSDIVTLHVPLDTSTRSLIGKTEIQQMKKGAILINTARGGIVDENSLKEALISKHLAGAAFDVFEIEPPQDMELVQLPHFFVTPHVGGSAQEAVLNMGRAAIRGLE